MSHPLPAVPTGPAPGAPSSAVPAAEKLDMGIQADADVRYSNADAPTRDETIRVHALSLAISEQSRLLAKDSLDTLLATAAAFETWIRDGAA